MKEEAVFPHLNIHQEEEEAPKKTPTKAGSFGYVDSIAYVYNMALIGD